MIVEQIPAENYTSNIYKIKIDMEVWFVDMGNALPALKSLDEFENVRGVFITHAHYDHIYGINHLNDNYPECKVYVSEYAKEGLYSEKLNLSFYHEDPFAYKGENVEIIYDSSVIDLSSNFKIKCIYTPGHNLGCMSFLVGDYFFTGDSFIPGIPVVTKLKSGNKDQNELSLQRINSIIKPETIVCPGHGPIYLGSSLLSY